MFKSDILNIRKVRSEANIKFFEYFGQPTCTYAIIEEIFKFSHSNKATKI